jgi:hypothetical protein
MHYKRRKRRRGGIKGCCWLCSLRTTDGTRNGRKLTKQELVAWYSYQEQMEGVKDGHGEYKKPDRKNRW